ncbi:pre-peptidase C-terminal domain-containing protein, partial [Candidatus Hydrogenedentota bacterium]
IDTLRDVDYFKFDAQAGDYAIETGGATDTKIYLYDTDGVTELSSDSDSGLGSLSQLFWSCATTGTYYIKVRHDYYDATGDYTLAVRSIVDDHGNTHETATPVTVGGSAMPGSIDIPGDVDFFSFVARKDFLYTIERGGSFDMILVLYDTDGTTMIAHNLGSDPRPVPQPMFEWICSAAGTYYVRVQRFERVPMGTGDYTLAISGEAISSLCSYKTLFINEWPLAAADFDLPDNDVFVPGHRIPERWGLAMVRNVLCDPQHPHHDRTLSAYETNLLLLETEETSIYERVEPYKHVLAALLLVSDGRQAHFIDLLGLQNEYVVVRSSDGGGASYGSSSSAPAAISEEIFSDDGDLNGDGETNADTYDRIVLGGGSIEGFAEEASGPPLVLVSATNSVGRGLLVLAILLAGLVISSRRSARGA